MSSRLRRISVAILTTMIATVALSAPAQSADKDPDLTVTITTLSPSWLKAGSDVTVRGTITNNDDHAWAKVQAYLVIPTSPFTTRKQVDDAIDNGAAYTGNRVIEVGTFDELDELGAGESTSFEVKVPYEQLGISGGAGVYPVGVQVLGTDTDGTRSNDAIARAATFLPSIAPGQQPVATTVVWPFLMSDFRDVDGNYDDPLATLDAIGPGGRLRNLLDLASSTPQQSSTVLIDPALLVSIDDIANRQHIAKTVELDQAQTAQAASFLQELLTYVHSRNTWILDFDRTDVLALSTSPDLRRPLTDAVDSATQTAATTYELIGRRVTWPTKNAATVGLLSAERGDGETPVIVTPGSVPGWERRLGSLVSYKSTSGPMPLLVNDVIAGVPGDSTVVALRQRILSDAALAGLQRAIDSTSKADAVTIVDPMWNPGPRATTGGLASVFNTPFVSGATLDDQLARQVSKYEGRVPTSSKARTVSRAQLEAASDLVDAGDALASIVSDDQGFDASYSSEVAGLLGVRWRTDPPLGISVASNRASRAAAELAKIKIEGPPSVTLSSSSGGFPLTINNDTAHDIRVGVDLDSSNPALDVPPVKAVTITAGESLTVTVNIDLGRQSTTQLTARLTTPEGVQIGAPSDEFNVRSSKIGVVLWVAIGLAGVFVLVAMFRRFRRQRTGTSAVERLADDD